MEILREAPKPSSFVPLIEHQSSTPASFYTGPPVLHYYSDRSKLVVLEHEAQSIPALAPLLEASAPQPDPQPQASTTNGTSDTNATGTQRVITELDVYVTSDKLLLYQNAVNVGLAIPYPSISLHAIQSLPSPAPGEQQGLYMQVLSKTPEAGEDEDPESISLTVIPTASAPPQVTSTASGTTETGLESEDEKEQTPVLAMFNALSACSNLHPDPLEPGDDDDGDDDAGPGGSRLFRAGLAFPGASDGGLPPAMPGSGGWITADNMHEFVDEEGNWIGGDDQGEGEDEEEEGNENGDGATAGGNYSPLGPGAGTVRPRDDGQQGNGADDNTKWR
ncbi:hypothetical protein G647_03868 [Cladophialophora carrionii CBS 160.54]|uniref:Regulator of volume decrease after cellular swelling-domain-containing protein n=1 Tax=Cladophialophora carrionii CBS 160.54 TaxID=1279043 RepID=V9DC75_9EURO|nr:uncharacterized protein G647_03868 [Cladophialophora carrionii CBS 160.54]ETI24499.1 hypothetical protein G647_03868 [Cladophialophora carrionii CBS 160.54]